MRTETSTAPRTHWPSVGVLWLSGIFAAMQFAKVAVAFTALQAHYGVSAAQTGWVLSTVGLVGLLLGVTMGLLAPSIGYRRLLLAGLCLGAVLAGLQSLLLPFAWFWATRVLEGASHLAVVVAAPTLMAASAGPRHRAMAMGLWSTFVGVAFTVAGAIGAALMAWGGLDCLFALHALGLAAMAVLVACCVPGAAPGTVRPPLPTGMDLLRRHAGIYTRWTTALPGLCFFGYTSMGVALMTFVPQQAAADRLLLATVLPLMGVAGNFCAGWLAQYWLSPLWLARLAFSGVFAAALALGLVLHLGLWLVPWGLLLMFLAGLAGGSSFALIPFLNHEMALQAQANGAVAQLGNLGSTLGPPLFALAIAQWGGAGLAACAVCASLLGLGLASWGARMHHRQS